MTDIHLIAEQTESDRKRLYANLKTRKKDFRLELIIYGVIWLIAPFMAGRSGQAPLIETMSYGKALFFFGCFFLIPLAFTYYFKVHKAVKGCQTGLKRVVVTKIKSKKKNLTFRKSEYCIKVEDDYLRKLYLPFTTFSTFEAGDTIKAEVSENGKQVIRIKKATARSIELLRSRETGNPVSEKISYTSVLFGQEPGEKSSFLSFLSFLVPSKHNFISVIILDINIFVFLLMLADGVSIYKPNVMDIVHWGGNVRLLTIGQGEYWRLLTNNFVHIGIIHLLMNALGFVFISIFLEGRLGRIRFLLLYLFTGLSASLVSVWWHNNTVSAGASGAIFGLVGFFLASLLLTTKKEREANSGIISSLLIFVGYNLLMGITGNIDNAAHIGGLISGFAAGAIMILFAWGRNIKKKSLTQ